MHCIIQTSIPLDGAIAVCGTYFHNHGMTPRFMITLWVKFINIRVQVYPDVITELRRPVVIRLSLTATGLTILYLLLLPMYNNMPYHTPVSRIMFDTSSIYDKKVRFYKYTPQL